LAESRSLARAAKSVGAASIGVDLALGAKSVMQTKGTIPKIGEAAKTATHLALSAALGRYHSMSLLGRALLDLIGNNLADQAISAGVESLK